MSGKRSRDWCFTLNNYTRDELKNITQNVPKLKDFVYMIAGKEIGAERTPHLQGYIYWKNPKSMQFVKGHLSQRVHLEVTAGTPQEASDYCKKEGNFLEFGTLPMSQSKKGDKGKEYWDNILYLAKAGRVDEIDSKIQITHCNQLETIRCRANLKKKLENTFLKHMWIWGPTGTGKSRCVREAFPDGYPKMANKWWDGYEDEDVAFIEDFDKIHGVLVHHLKIWADHYPFIGEVKTKARKMRPKLLIITSNYHPETIWTDASDLEPIMRRFTVVKMDTPGQSIIFPSIPVTVEVQAITPPMTPLATLAKAAAKRVSFDEDVIDLVSDGGDTIPLTDEEDYIDLEDITSEEEELFTDEDERWASEFNERERKRARESNKSRRGYVSDEDELD